MRTLEEIRAFFKEDHFACDAAKIRIEEVTPLPERRGYRVVCTMPIEEIHLNANHHVMGGAIFTLADFCFAVAANGPDETRSAVTTSSTIHYVGVCRGSRLIASLEPVHCGKTMQNTKIRIRDNLGNDVAIVLSSGLSRPSA